MKLFVLAGALAALSTAAFAQEVVRAGSTEAKPGPSENFTGSVRVRLLISPTAPGQAGTALVAFQPGARSNWHTHPAGQTLYVTEGCGWTQVEGGPVTRICRGDTIYAKPGVKHWHGGTAITAMTHLAISETRDGKKVDWLQPVTAAQYRGPAR
ncbi:cupin domain-containing protein [Sphingomonas montana]|uniref:(R)-mandelonitrile lyase n=1 Tax=Sphingomonas montana TaxID=1843236 RepID=UPI00096E92B2|nr:cupin domain-containing protein [Sphingomonas montana]